METRFPPNPIRNLRDSLAMTQKELAELAQVSPQRVLREEQFVYEQPSPKILDVLVKYADGASADHLCAEYVHCRKQLHEEFTQDLTGSNFYEHHVRLALDYATDYFDALSVMRSPTKLFREYLFEAYGLPTSAIKFTIYTGMHPGTLSDIETGKTDWDGAGALIEVYVNQLLLPDDVITHLGTLHDQFFMRKA